ncbi:uncharacterized protein LOC133291693 [Gastrolobium bilobum]|uniref:uncharacterized protein LOC133291693 n=1 Tax=Gastrolobium bilobum TaxID=150636 RepID=UPI002AAFA888|nr:uncharacterized protein LOC133291693 [Gastrolobium bilobum]
MDPLQHVVQFLMSPQTKAWLKQQLVIPLLQYEARVAELKVCVQSLKKVRDVVQHKVEEEENRYGRRFAEEVKEWIEGVDKIISEYEDFDGDECNKHAVFDFFTSGFLPKPGIRYHLSKKAFNITRKVNALEQKAKHDAVSYWLGPPSMVAFFTNVGYESFPSRDETVNKINAALEDPNVRMIGLHGLSGVGKTSLVKRVAKEALKAKMFDVVTMSSITRNADIRKIQGEIADMLGMKLDEESDIARAARIQKRLKNDKESTLVILDDLWAEIDFNMLGIPCDDDERKSPGAHSITETEKSHAAQSKEKTEPETEKSRTAQSKEKTELGAANMMKSKKHPSESNAMKTEETLSRYKVLMISESKQVLLSQMEGKGNSIFSVEVLKDKEAETLFKKKAAIGDTNSDLEILAAQIAKKCNGLPISIVTTARALKNQSRLVWENINRELEGKNLMGAPEFSTKLSYDLLENEELKYTFLLCARMGHDALIMDLVRSYIGLGFRQGISTVREARCKVYALVGKLKESGLLSESYSNDHFTMQDIVRSAALSIALEEKHVFTVTKGKIDEWPDEDKLKRYAGISLQHCDIIGGFPRMINCPQLRFFHVDNSYPRLTLPDNFFKKMKELKVLILTGFDLSPLPSSVTCLTKLRMLCLEECTLGEKLSNIGELKNLRILSFSRSDIEKLPVELKELTKLQILDISNCSKLQKIPSNVINSLISLEELYIGNTLIQWSIEGQTNQSERASLSELRHLNLLTTVDLKIPNVDHFPNNLFFDKLYSYKIIIGDLKAYLKTDFKVPQKYETSRFLAIQLNDSFDIHSLMGIKMLFNKVEILLLEDLNGVQDIFYSLNLKGFLYLKHLCIVSNSHIQSLINPTHTEQPEEAFLKLESLYLYDLKKLDTICSCKLSAFSFGKLKAVKIYQCGQLKCIFNISMVRHLTVLETIEVSECNTLKEIVKIVPVETRSNTEHLEFLELRTLSLQSLPQITGFCPISSTGGEMRKLFHEKVIVPKLERMELSLIHIDIIWSDQPSLCSSFQNLIHLDVNECWDLKYLLSFSMAKTLVNLQSLSVSECENMEHIFRQEHGSHTETKGSIFPNLKKIKLSSMKRLHEIWNYELPSDSFGKLDTLIIEKCDKFVNVFPCYMKGIFRSLCNLSVTNCRSMKEIFDLNDLNGDASDVANLQDVHLEGLPKLKHVWKKNEDWEVILNLKKLQKIWVHDCGILEYIFPIYEAKCLPNLEYLVIWDCSDLREIVARGKGTNTDSSNSNPSFEFPNMITIKFSKLPNLESFYPRPYKLSCPKLNDLCVELCDKLEPFRKETADAEGKFVLFPKEVINQLKSLQIESWHVKLSSSYMGEGNYRRNKLQELRLSKLYNTEVLYSFLHSNPNLKSLSLIHCFFKEMVPLRRPPEIQKLGVVPELKSLKLIDLPKLEKIGFERDILLQRIEFFILESCPCLVSIVPSSVSLTYLTDLEVVNCNGLENLMPPSTAKSLIHLRTMKVIKCESLKEIVSVQGNEDKVDIVFKQLKSLELVSLKKLKSFCSSKNCVFEFPSLEKLVKFFEGMDEMSLSEHHELEQPGMVELKELEVEHCDEVKAIFDMNDIDTEIIGTTFQLKKLTLKWLNELTHVWEKNGQGILIFQNLQEVFVHCCEKLETLFPAALAKNLKKLEQLTVQFCNELKEIVGKKEAAAAAQVREKFVFPCLTSLSLYDLPQLAHFCPETIPLECPALNYLFVVDCKLVLFQRAHQWAISNLEVLVLQWKHTSELRSMFGQFTVELNSLKNLVLFSDVYNNKEPIMPFGILEKAPNLEEMTTSVLPQMPEIGKQGMPGHLKVLTLNIVKELKSIGSEDSSWLNTLCEKLYKLYVIDCRELKTLVHSHSDVSFSNLKELSVSGCYKLEYLFTSSTVKVLKNLEKIEVEDCKSMKEIVKKEQDETTSEGIKFERLSWIILKKLYELKYFYSGNETLELPSLIQVDILNCSKMEIFSQGSVDASSFRGIQGSADSNDDLIFHEDVKASVKKLLRLQQLTRQRIQFGDHPILEEIWLKREPVPVPSWCFFNLTCLVVVRCDFLSDAILPSHLLPFLSNLEELQVQNCNLVTAIFDDKIYMGSASDPFSIRLKKLILDQLPSLKHIWCKDSQGRLRLPFLEEVYVDGCESIKSLFPASVAKDGLQELHVKNCEGLEEIFAKDEATKEEENKESIILPNITSLRLRNLPKLGCIYPGVHIEEWPTLKEIDVMLEILLKGQDSSPTESTDEQVFISLKKV